MDKRTLKAAQALQKKHGTSYFFATRFFPIRLREATFALYSFVRIPDEIVDNPPEGSDPKQELISWRKKWREAVKTGKTNDDGILVATVPFRESGIPLEYGEDFLAAMLADTTQTRYETYSDLEKYMYGSAAVVGLMMVHLIGKSTGADAKKIERAAIAVGNAMQLTNFLRDIDEDYVQRNRIYLPRNEMVKFGVTEETIASRKMTPQLRALLKFNIERARRLYAEGEEVIRLLHPDGQLAVLLASRLYAEILKKIEQQQYDIFLKRAATSKFEKLRILRKTRKEIASWHKKKHS